MFPFPPDGQNQPNNPPSFPSFLEEIQCQVIWYILWLLMMLKCLIFFLSISSSIHLFSTQNCRVSFPLLWYSTETENDMLKRYTIQQTYVNYKFRNHLQPNQMLYRKTTKQTGWCYKVTEFVLIRQIEINQTRPMCRFTHFINYRLLIRNRTYIRNITAIMEPSSQFTKGGLLTKFGLTAKNN